MIAIDYSYIYVFYYIFHTVHNCALWQRVGQVFKYILGLMGIITI